MIDAGHGGNDPGHLSNNSAHKTEKELNLLIAQKFGNYVSTLLQNVEIVYSRTTDVYLTLDERVEIANSKGVDIFISIHCNANEKTKVHGTESHIHSFDAKKSVELARTFEKEFSGKAGRTSRGVKDNNDREHSLQVLKYTKMTSVLVECGFLTNTREANYLNTAEGQDIIASALFRGLRTFLQKNYPSIAFVKSADKKKSTEKKKDEKFYVQITSSIDAIDTEHDSFKRTGNTVIREKLNTTNAYKYRYLIGEFATKKEAEEVLKKVKTKGFPDAFVVKK
jgi:N-acetylmuramoyl-L-alanine amidase